MDLLSLDTKQLEWDAIMKQNKENRNIMLPATKLEQIKQTASKKELLKEEIAKRKQIPTSQISVVKENANLYEDHPILKQQENHLFFYRDQDGIIRAEYYDEKTNQIKPSQLIKPSITEIRKEVSIGKDDFKKVIDGNCYYVDKSELIKDIYGVEVLLYTRPRRFGKTLNVSMLNYFYNIKEKRECILV